MPLESIEMILIMKINRKLKQYLYSHHTDIISMYIAQSPLIANV